MLETGPRKLQFSFTDPDDAATASRAMLSAGPHEGSATPDAAAQSGQEPWRDGVDIGVVIDTLRARRPLLAASALIGAAICSALAVGWLAARAPRWSATTEILVSNTSLALSGQDAVVTQLMVENTLLQSQMLLARSNAVLERAIERLGPAKVTELLPGPGPVGQIRENIAALLPARRPAVGADAQRERRALMASLKEAIAINRLGASQIIGLTARGSSADGAAVLANEMTQAFLAESREINAVVTTSGVFRDRIRVLGPTVRLISDATPPTAKDGPRALLALAAGPIGGGLLGLMVGLALALSSRRIWGARRLEAVTGLPCLGVAPANGRPNGKSRNGPSLGDRLRPGSLTRDRPRASSLTDVLRSVRAVASERRRKTPRILGIAGPPDDGARTMIAKGLALLLAADDQRVLLIDGDAGAAMLTEAMALGEAPGLRELLGGGANLSEAVHASLRGNLDVMGVGVAPADLDGRWPQLRRALAGHGPQPAHVQPAQTPSPQGGTPRDVPRPYAWVIIDLPSPEPAAALRAAGAAVDDMILVAPRGRIAAGALRRALSELGPTRDKLFGAVLAGEGDEALATLGQRVSRGWQGLRAAPGQWKRRNGEPSETDESRQTKAQA